MSEKTFSMEDLVNYIVVSDDYLISFADALDFAADFAAERDITIDREDAEARWYERNGWSRD